jgi:RimK family alpha-L-glutamate ligase
VPRVGIVAHRNADTNAELCRAWCALGIEAHVLTPVEALGRLREGDTAVLRIDVRPTLDGCESGLDVVPDLRLYGVRVVNAPSALLAAHDKLWSERRLADSGLRRPACVHVCDAGDPVPFPPPYVVKPRYGSWGREVVRCRTVQELRSVLRRARGTRWFATHGALVQELLPSSGRDLRALVADGRVVGSAARVALPGEWRTNVALGAALVPATLDGEQRRLAVAAVDAIGGDFMAVDLLPSNGGTIVLEVNGTPDFDATYGPSVYADAAEALGIPRPGRVAA